MKRLFFLLLAAFAGAGCSDSGEPALPPEAGQEVVQPDDVSGVRLLYELTQRRSHKRGVSYNFQLEEDVRLLAPGISWSYNWGPDVASQTIASALGDAEIAFFPMAWNGRFDSSRIRAWRAAHPESHYLLAFNEPNLNDQARMTPQEAAAEWPRLKALAEETGMKIIAPAMNYGTLPNYGDPIVWLDEFFSLVPIDDVDGIAIHCYMGTPGAVKSYVQRFYKYQKPIWLTEFCGWEESCIGSLEAQRRHMAQVVGYLEADDHVAAYAWFIPRGSGSETTFPYNSLLTKTRPYRLTATGELYCNYTSLDREARFSPQEVIPAEQFIACNAGESACEPGWTPFPDVRKCTDATGLLELYDLFVGQWVEYALHIPDSGTRPLYIRYSAPTDAEIEIACGEYSQRITLPRTGDGNWSTASPSITTEAGDRTLRLTVTSGRTSLNWLSLR